MLNFQNEAVHFIKIVIRKRIFFSADYEAVHFNKDM